MRVFKNYLLRLSYLIFILMQNFIQLKLLSLPKFPILLYYSITKIILTSASVNFKNYVTYQNISLEKLIEKHIF